MAVNAGSVYVDLGARLDRREFEAYEKELRKVQERTQRKEHFRAQLGGDFDPRAFNAYERELRKTERSHEDVIKGNARLRTSFGTVWGRGGAALAAAGGAYGLVTAVKSVTNAYAESQVSQTKMATQLKALGISYDAHAKQIDKVIQSTSKLAGLDDEDLQDAFTAVVRSTGNVNESLKEMTLVADLARAKHMDVAAAGQTVARVHAGNVRVLKSLGIEFVASTKNVDELKKSTDKYTPAQLAAAKAADKQANSTRAIGLLQDKLKGTAEAYGRTQAGATDRAKVAFENLQETLGKKLSPAITRGANALARFINDMDEGRGAGGQFAAVLGRIGRGIQKFGDDFNSNERQVAGWITGIGRAESTVLKFTGTVLGGSAGRKLKEWGHNVDANADQIDRWRKELRITREVNKIEDDLDRLKNKTSGTLHGILTATHRNMAEIRKTMGTESARGQEAIHDNFQAAVTAIRRAMRNGEISTKTGLAQIRRDMQLELKDLGISSALRGGLPLSKNPPKGDLPVTTNSAGVTKYGGGWIGLPGMVGPDTVPAMLAPGEAVLNRHQQAVIEGMLGDGFLDRLFSTVQRPHYMQHGGRIRRRFAGGGVAGAVSAADQLEQAHFPYRWGGGHQATPAPFGPMDCSGAVSYVLQHAGVNIPTLTSGLLAGRGDPGEGALTVWANPVHTFMRIGNRFFGTSGTNPGGGAGWMPDPGAGYRSRFTVRHFAGGATGPGGDITGVTPITAPTVGGSGALHDIVQGVLTRTAAGATQRARALAASAGLGTGDPGDPGPVAGKGKFGFNDLQSLWTGVGGRSARAAIMAHIALAESGGDPKARNPSGASGLWQILGLPFPGDPFNPGVNARMAIAKSSNGANLGPWTASRAAWGQFATRGGRFAKGGKAKADKLTKTVGGATAGLIRKIRPVQTDRSERFDSLMARVESADQSYSRWERRFNISDEELVDSDTGAINVQAIQRKAKELGQLILIRAGMERDLEAARDTAKAIVASYRKVVRALRNSLRHAKGKNRTGIRSYISQYEPRIAEWQGKIGEVGGTLFDTRSDILELKGELKGVLGTSPQLQATSDTSGDTGTDLGGDASDIAPDTTTAPPTAADIAAGVLQQIATFNQGRVDLLSQFAPNFANARQAYSPGGAFSGTPDELTAAAGVRYFGGTGGGSLGGLTGGTVVAHFASAPPDPPSFVQQVRFLVENGSGG